MFKNNRANAASAFGGQGGALANYGNEGCSNRVRTTMTATNCLFTGYTPATTGGALNNDSNGDLFVINSTIVGNDTNPSGGDGNGSPVVDMDAYEFGSLPMGDLSCDGAVNALDIPALILALMDPVGYAAAHPACDIALADVDCSGLADPADIGPLVQLLLGP